MSRRQGVMVTTAFLLLTCSGAPCFSQQSASPQRPLTPDASHGLGDSSRPDDPFSAKLAEQQARGRNSDRQRRLVADTDKLLTLATELKQQVDKTDKNVLSVDVVKKADEIEKLAHSVKEKMKGGA
ncbi:MAG: hypothetical protein NVSMB3_11750 [Acidobacteriaceae bacterium]